MPHASFDIIPAEVPDAIKYAAMHGGSPEKARVTFSIPLDKVTQFTVALHEAGVGPIEVELAK